MKRQFFSIRVGLAAALALMLSQCGEPSLLNRQVKPPNVVIIVMDTARRDRLSCYGYSRDTSPNLTNLMKSSRTYYSAYSTTCWTAPAHVSLFTGLFPIAHKTTQKNFAVTGSVDTLAEVLSEHGYEAFGIVENPVVARLGGYGQGFAKYFETWRFKEEIDGECTAVYLLKTRIAGLEVTGRPFFLFVNLIAPHNPYDSSRQFYGRFVSDPSIDVTSNQWHEYYMGERQFTEAELRHLDEMYDAELLFVDHVVGRMIDILKERGHWDNTVFIVTSDHGENIGDHGLVDHVFSLHETTTKIPLIIHYPKAFPPGSDDYRLVQLTDIFPTVLALVGIDKADYPCQGHDLTMDTNPEDGAIFCEYDYPYQALSVFPEDSPALDRYRRPLRSVIAGPMKFVWAGDGKHELYDLSKDPNEQSNLIEQEEYSDVVEQLSARLEEMVENYYQEREEAPVVGLWPLHRQVEDYSPERKGPPGQPELVMDEATREALRALGYLR